MNILVGHVKLDHTDEGTATAPTCETRKVLIITTRNSSKDRLQTTGRCMIVENESIQPQVRLSMNEMVGVLVQVIVLCT